MMLLLPFVVVAVGVVVSSCAVFSLLCSADFVRDGFLIHQR